MIRTCVLVLRSENPAHHTWALRTPLGPGSPLPPDLGQRTRGSQGPSCTRTFCGDSHRKKQALFVSVSLCPGESVPSVVQAGGAGSGHRCSGRSLCPLLSRSWCGYGTHLRRGSGADLAESRNMAPPRRVTVRRFTLSVQVILSSVKRG